MAAGPVDSSRWPGSPYPMHRAQDPPAALQNAQIKWTQQNEGGRIVVTGNPGSAASSDPYRQFNVAAFATPGLGSLGQESGRNFLYRSPVNSWGCHQPDHSSSASRNFLQRSLTVAARMRPPRNMQISARFQF
jgi:hypothetical protein